MKYILTKIIENIITASDNDQNPNFRLSIYDSFRQLEYHFAREREKMVDEIVNEVLLRFGTTVDIKEAIQKIEQLSDAINNLRNGGK